MELVHSWAFSFLVSLTGLVACLIFLIVRDTTPTVDESEIDTEIYEGEE